MVLVGETAESLLHFAEEKNTDGIVIGGVRDGFFGRHGIGPVATALLYSSSVPVILAPAGLRDDPPDELTAVTAAVPNNAADDNPPRSPSRWRARPPEPADDFTGFRRQPVRRRLPGVCDGFRSSTRVQHEAGGPVASRMPRDRIRCRSGHHVESALRKLRWNESDILVIGSSRLGARRGGCSSGSTAARILAGFDGPGGRDPRSE